MIIGLVGKVRARRTPGSPELSLDTAANVIAVSYAERRRLSTYVRVLGVWAGSLAMCPDLYHLFLSAECR